MEQPIRIAAVGAGAWGKNIVRTLHRMGSLALVAEASVPLREQLAAEYPDLEIVAGYGEVFGRPDIAAVTIATPAPTHHRIARDCLLAGKDVFVEKPMTLTSVESEDLVQTADQYGRVLMTGHLLLYKPAVAFLRGYLQAGHLGRIFTMHQERAKLGKARAVENALWSLGVHDVAALLYLAGSAPERVACFGHRGLQAGIEDDTYLHLTFPGGMQAHLHNSWLWPEDRRSLTVIGEKGMLVYDEKAERVTLLRKTIDDRLASVDGGSDVLFEAPKDFQALEEELRHFIGCVQTRAVPRSCGRNGLEVVRVLEQAAL